ncbi:hypothetical protein QT331_28180 (plasmid) [Escherichia coli]|uniref:hypothetical protein n=1 Tax=Escherichia coli TaxID=562 RepID=UPI00259C8834|nr:hypothetical protein [Escherichia coli]MDM4993495.1 hypothetical protein [Escherichia coli]
MSSRVRTEIKLLALLAYVPIRYVEDNSWFAQWLLTIKLRFIIEDSFSGRNSEGQYIVYLCHLEVMEDLPEVHVQIQSRLQGYVGGTLISVNASNNPAYGKTAFISFAVPAGTSYQITSYPTENTSCGARLVFSVFGYQTYY